MEVLQCYICYEEGSDTKPLAIDPRPCDCKGSIAIHKACFQDVIEKNMRTNCAACGKYYNPVYCIGYEKGVVYDTGNHGMRRKYHVNERFEKHGLYQEFWPGGQIYRQIDYENGKIHGLSRAWHNDGQLWLCQKYIHGKTHTPLKYYMNGKIYKVERFICDGTKEGGIYI